MVEEREHPIQRWKLQLAGNRGVNVATRGIGDHPVSRRGEDRKGLDQGAWVNEPGLLV